MGTLTQSGYPFTTRRVGIVVRGATPFGGAGSTFDSPEHTTAPAHLGE